MAPRSWSPQSQRKRAEEVAGEALGVQPGQGCVLALRLADQDGVLFRPAIGRPERDDAHILGVGQRYPRLADRPQGRGRQAAIASDGIDRDRQRRQSPAQSPAAESLPAAGRRACTARPPPPRRRGRSERPAPEFRLPTRPVRSDRPASPSGQGRCRCAPGAADGPALGSAGKPRLRSRWPVSASKLPRGARAGSGRRTVGQHRLGRDAVGRSRDRPPGAPARPARSTRAACCTARSGALGSARRRRSITSTFIMAGPDCRASRDTTSPALARFTRDPQSYLATTQRRSASAGRSEHDH